ncbi:androgen-induced gene 1 protein [Hyalella azteca]|uniref:Androgen-induced gene 1 protein n=1 Tax=Hyalella azteca TaxID=294128 RepID=A0A8B7N654_HYAAZ|nr:androgen-induced gene 1 protein [Hyalella azteca]
MGLESLLFHVVVTAGFALSVYWDYFMLQMPIGSKFREVTLGLGNRCKYLTHIDMLLQLSYFSLALLNDIVGTDHRQSNKQGSLQRFRDWLFTTLVFPVGSFVAVVFLIST